MKSLHLLVFILLAAMTAAAQGTTLQAIAIVPAGTGVSVRLALSGPVAPHVRPLTNPARIEVDLPGCNPAPNVPTGTARSPVTGVTVTLLSSSPPLTQVIISLDNAVTPSVNSTGNVINIGLGAAASPGNSSPAPVPNQAPAPQVRLPSSPAHNATASASAAPLPAAPAAKPKVQTEFDIVAPPPPPPPPKVLNVSFRNGMLTIYSERATLSEVLTEVKKLTGADITIPAGAQEPVFAKLGPAPAREVLNQLLTGSNYNFIMTSDDNDPRQLRSLVLLPKSGGG